MVHGCLLAQVMTQSTKELCQTDIAHSGLGTAAPALDERHLHSSRHLTISGTATLTYYTCTFNFFAVFKSRFRTDRDVHQCQEMQNLKILCKTHPVWGEGGFLNERGTHGRSLLIPSALLQTSYTACKYHILLTAAWQHHACANEYITIVLRSGC